MARKILIDTDTACDDAAALIMAMKSPELDLCAVTSVFGNVPVEQATANALMCLEIVRAPGEPPRVYSGAPSTLNGISSPMGRIQGRDGMGDCGLIHPETAPGTLPAVDAILHLAETYPGELEILSIGPATNLASAIRKSPGTMKKVKKIYSMSSGGFGPGNITAHAEFNVYCDPPAYKILLDSGIPLCVTGFDVCRGKAFFTASDIAALEGAENRESQFLFKSTRKLRQFMKEKTSTEGFSLPDAVALAVLLDRSLIRASLAASPSVHTEEGELYGKVSWAGAEDSPVELCREIDGNSFKNLFFMLLNQ